MFTAKAQGFGKVHKSQIKKPQENVVLGYLENLIFT